MNIIEFISKFQGSRCALLAPTYTRTFFSGHPGSPLPPQAGIFWIFKELERNFQIRSASLLLYHLVEWNIQNSKNVRRKIPPPPLHPSVRVTQTVPFQHFPLFVCISYPYGWYIVPLSFLSKRNFHCSILHTAPRQLVPAPAQNHAHPIPTSDLQLVAAQKKWRHEI